MEKVQIKKIRPEKEDKISILSPPFTRIKEFGKYLNFDDIFVFHRIMTRENIRKKIIL